MRKARQKNRNSRPEMFCKKGILRNFLKFTGKDLRQSLFFLACNFVKKETLTQLFSCEFCTISNSTFSSEVVYVTIGNPAFCLALYLTGVHFRGKLQHVVHGGEQKIKCSPIRNQEIAAVRLQEELCVTEHLRWLLLKKDGCRRRGINDGIFINEKEKKSSTAKKVVREIFLLYHSLSFVVTRCTTRCHSIYHSSVFL